MARPSCPLCGDSWSVVKVTSLARRPDLPHGTVWDPPRAPGGLGRYVLTSAVAALVLYVGTGGALLCSVLALCAGVIAELVMAWERADTYEAYRQAQARWQTAYYCSTHDRVFGVREPFLCSPAGFAALLGRGMAPDAGAAGASPAGQPGEAVALLGKSSLGPPPEALWGTSGETPAARVAGGTAPRRVA
jgi:hypothetical protein